MTARPYFLVLCSLFSFSSLAFAGGRTLAFTQSNDGTISAVFITGPCPIGGYPSQQGSPTATVDANQISIASPGGILSYFGTLPPPPCDANSDPGYMLPATIGKLADGHYQVDWNFEVGDVAGAFDVASGSLVTASAGIPNATSVSGFWYDPLYSGSGFNFQLSNNGLLGTYFGWDAQGNRLWLTTDIGPKSLSVGVPIVFNMTYTTGGSFGMPQHNVAQWGSLVVNFSSCKAGTASLAGTDGIQNFSLVQLSGIAGLPGC